MNAPIDSQRLLSALDNVAVISTTDLNDHITHANDLMQDYESVELAKAVFDEHYDKA